MTKRFVLEQEPPERWIADSYILVAICLPLLCGLLAWLFGEHARSSAIALVLAVMGVLVGLAKYLGDLQLRVTLLLGDDGFVVYGNKVNKSFVSHDAIQRVAAMERSFVEIDRTDGSTLAFRACPKFPTLSRDQCAHEIAAAIEAARESFRVFQNCRVEEHLFHRSGRRAVEIVRDLKSLAQPKVETYRSAPLDRARFMSIAENPAAGTQDRVSAFIALRVDSTDDDSVRLGNSLAGVANEATAARLRVAMYSDDDAELARALELDEEEEAGPLSLPQRIRRRRAI